MAKEAAVVNCGAAGSCSVNRCAHSLQSSFQEIERAQTLVELYVESASIQPEASQRCQAFRLRASALNWNSSWRLQFWFAPLREILLAPNGFHAKHTSASATGRYQDETLFALSVPLRASAKSPASSAVNLS